MAILETGTSSNTSGGSASKGVCVVTAIGTAIEEQLGSWVGDEKPRLVFVGNAIEEQLGCWVGDEKPRVVFVAMAIGTAIEEQLGCCVGDKKPRVVVGLWVGDDSSLFLADKMKSLDGDMVAAGSNFGTEGRVVGGGDLIEVREAERFLLVAEPNLYKVSGGGGGGGGGGSCGDVREGDLVLTGKNALCGGEDGPSLWEVGTGGGEREGDFIFLAFGKAMWGGTISLFTGLLGLFKPEGR